MNTLEEIYNKLSLDFKLHHTMISYPFAYIDECVEWYSRDYYTKYYVVKDLTDNTYYGIIKNISGKLTSRVHLGIMNDKRKFVKHLKTDYYDVERWYI